MSRFAPFLLVALLVGVALLAGADPVYAGKLADAGKKLSTEITTIIGALFLAVLAIGAVVLFWSRQYPAMIVMLVAGCFVAFLVMAPATAAQFMKSVGVDIFS